MLDFIAQETNDVREARQRVTRTYHAYSQAAYNDADNGEYLAYWEAFLAYQALKKEARRPLSSYTLIELLRMLRDARKGKGVHTISRLVAHINATYNYDALLKLALDNGCSPIDARTGKRFTSNTFTW